MSYNRRAWLTVAQVWVLLALIMGVANILAGLFYGPVSREFHTTRAEVALLSSAFSVGACLGSLAAGWLLEAFPIRRVMVAGALLMVLSFVFCSRATAFSHLAFYYCGVGVGAGLACLISASLIIGNWFGNRGGLAMGLAMTGTTLGGGLMTLVVSWAIGRWGWRGAFAGLAVPTLLLAVPLILSISPRPPSASARQPDGGKRGPVSLSGMALHQALRGREFWIVGYCWFACGYAGNSLLGHFVSYLQGLGYSRAHAATAFSAMVALAGLGKIILGLLTDRLGARLASFIGFAIETGGLLLLLGAAQSWLMLLGLGDYGLSWGVPLALLPLLTIDCFGLKNYAALAGLTTVGFNVGCILGPFATGYMFDRTNGYALALIVNAAVIVLAASSVLACRSLRLTQPSTVLEDQLMAARGA